MRKKPEIVKPDDPAGDQVRLPPVLGIRPGVYLSALYGLVILAVLFFLCVFPGLSRPGSLVSFATDPQGAAIRVDGVTLGATPDELFLDRGVYSVELVLPGFESRSFELDVPGRAAFSLFFPRRLQVTRSLPTGDPVSALAAAAADYAAWSFTGEATASYQIPLSLSEGVYRAGPSLDDGGRAEAAELIRAAARFAVSQASLRDLARAQLLLDNGGFAPSALSLSRSVGDIASWLSSAPGAADWLAGLLPPEAAALVRDSAWARGAGQAEASLAAEVAAEASLAAEAAPGGAAPEIGGIRFLPASGDGGAFYYAESPVQAGAWAAFLEARPEWKPENLESLRERKLANGDYLAGQEGEGAARTGVSWYAAAAFCEWLGGRLPPAFEGWEIRLPREDEWEALSGAAPAAAGAASGLWEWCDDPYAPLRRFPAERRAIERLSSPERLLRGAHRPASRGSLPPDLCSAFVVFRPVIAPAEAAQL
ncbi:MAG: SUMF1/EgtB/PvdO family nonheme iron enzyme [Treponema sp.]|jgi:hypothetical protein|nr:SUMF1/EgtB/PvdO family nonheme iron enzyme [Treponema sp.]